MNRLARMMTITVATLFSVVGFGQDADGPPADEIEFDLDERTYADIQRYLKMSRDEFREARESGGFDLNAAFFKVISLGIGADNDGEEKQQLKEATEKYRKDVLEHHKTVRVRIKTRPEAAWHYWSLVHQSSRTTAGVSLTPHTRKAPSPGDNFLLSLSYHKPIAEAPAAVKIASIHTSGVEFAAGGRSWHDSMLLKEFAPCIQPFRRLGNQAAYVAINFEGGASSVVYWLDEIPPPAPPRPELYGGELVINGGGDEGWSSRGWDSPQGHRWPTQGDTRPPASGPGLWWPGHHPGDLSEYVQTIDLEDAIKSQRCFDHPIEVTVSGYLGSCGSGNWDESELSFEMLSRDGVRLDSVTSGRLSPKDSWVRFQRKVSLPAKARKIRVKMSAYYCNGSDTDSYFDALSVRLNYRDR